MVWTTVGICAALLTMSGFVPQVVKMWQTRSVRDVSGLTVGQLSGGVALWIVYGIHLDDFIIITANAMSLAILLIAGGLYLKFNRNKPQG